MMNQQSPSQRRNAFQPAGRIFLCLLGVLMFQSLAVCQGRWQPNAPVRVTVLIMYTSGSPGHRRPPKRLAGSATLQLNGKSYPIDQKNNAQSVITVARGDYKLKAFVGGMSLLWVDQGAMRRQVDATGAARLPLDGDCSLRLTFLQGGTAGPPDSDGPFSAQLDCDPLEVVPNQQSKICHIIISGWCRNTSRPVEVIFPKESDGFGSQDEDGVTGIVIPIGRGTVDTSNMSGFRDDDGGYGKTYKWTLFVRARGNATPGPKIIPIIVRQENCGQVRLDLTVRVLPGRGGRGGSTATNSSGSKLPSPRSGSTKRPRTARVPQPKVPQPRVPQPRVAQSGTTGGTGGSATTPANRQKSQNQFNEGNRLAEDGNWTQAMQRFRAALQLDPNNSEAWSGLGDAYANSNQWSEAEKAYRGAVRANPQESLYHAQLAKALLKQGRRAEAIKEAQTARRLGLEDHEVFDELGV